jgi:hypothetical protein
VSAIGPIEPLRDSVHVEPAAPARRIDRRRSTSEEENSRRQHHERPQDDELEDEPEDGLPHIDVLA